MTPLKVAVKVRPYRPKDESFVLATWLQNLYFYSRFKSRMPKGAFMEWMHQRAETIMINATVIVACDPEDEDVIYGYRVSGTDKRGLHIVHYVYVKGTWKRLGIATKLMEDVPESFVYPHRTDDLVFFARKFPSARHQPPIEEVTI